MKIFFYLILLLSLVACNNDLESLKKKFGIDQNITRAKLSLVPVTPEMRIVADPTLEDRRFIFVNEQEPGLTSPAYLRKIIVLDSAANSLSLEEDYFKNPNENKYLIIQHQYYSGKTNINFQEDDQKIEVGRQQADSILNSWYIKQNPFIILQ